ncbi:hypothetical protein KBD33_03995 [Candidatus Gracilibacteria bacterium]|nr:hypothetical protein [Candidatus Gracilibacteria bacterium]
MQNIFNYIAIAGTIAVSSCSESMDRNFGHGITIIDTREKAMLVLSEIGTIICSNNLNHLSTTPQIQAHMSTGFEQRDNNPLWRMDEKQYRVMLTPDKLTTIIQSTEGDTVLKIENRNGNGTHKFKNQHEKERYLNECKKIKDKAQFK